MAATFEQKGSLAADTLVVGGKKVPQTLTFCAPLTGAFQFASGGFTDIPLWRADNSYQLTGAAVMIGVRGSTSAALNIGHCYNASGGQSFASASRLTAANVELGAATIGSAFTLNGSFQTFAAGDVLVAHLYGYWSAAMVAGTQATLSFTLQRV